MTAEISYPRWARGKAGRPAAVMYGVQRNDHERGVGVAERSSDSRFETPTRGITCRPKATRCSSSEAKSDWRSMFTS